MILQSCTVSVSFTRTSNNKCFHQSNTVRPPTQSQSTPTLSKIFKNSEISEIYFFRFIRSCGKIHPMDTSTRSGLNVRSVGESEEESRDPDDYVPVLYVDCKTKLYHKKTIFCTINGNVANDCNFVFAKIGPGVKAILPPADE